jgi:hypothetical protein
MGANVATYRPSIHGEKNKTYYTHAPYERKIVTRQPVTCLATELEPTPDRERPGSADRDSPQCPQNTHITQNWGLIEYGITVAGTRRWAWTTSERRSLEAVMHS